MVRNNRDQPRGSQRGFAAMDEKKQREIAKRGGQASGGNFKNNPTRAAEAGRTGGQRVPAAERSFSRNPGLAAEAGRKGGEHSRGGMAGGAQTGRQPIAARHDGGHEGSAHPAGGALGRAGHTEPALEAGKRGGEHGPRR